MVEQPLLREAVEYRSVGRLDHPLERGEDAARTTSHFGDSRSHRRRLTFVSSRSNAVYTSVATIAEVGFAATEKTGQALDPEVEEAMDELWSPASPVTLDRDLGVPGLAALELCLPVPDAHRDRRGTRLYRRIPLRPHASRTRRMASSALIRDGLPRRTPLARRYPWESPSGSCSMDLIREWPAGVP